MPFLDRLSCALALTVSGATYNVVAGNVERLEATLAPWGFEASVTFLVVCVIASSEDTLFAPFTALDQATAALTVVATYDEEGGADLTPITLTGLVTDKEVSEVTAEEIASAPVLVRRYRVRFADRARVLWSQHFPTRLYVDSTLAALFSDNLPDGVTLSHGWSASSASHPVLSLGLGVDENQASFYDFVGWLLDRQAAGLQYTPATDAYAILDAKPDGGAALDLDPTQVASVEVLLPPVRRATVHVLNAYSEASDRDAQVDNAQSAQGVRADYLIRSSIAADLDARVTLETSRAQQRLAGARVAFSRFPSKPLAPWMNAAFGDGFSASLFVHGKAFRVARARLEAALDADQEKIAPGPSARFSMSYEVDLEQAADPVFQGPRFTPPRWPFHVEGKVVSETGDDDELTYQIYTDQSTSIDQYKVQIPLYEGKKVVVDFEPMTQGGMFYFPAYKGERVLVALGFDVARFAGYLDWRPGARLPLDSQGNHLLLGKKAASQTSIRHVYTEEKPVFSILRTNGTDVQTLVVSEGTLTMTTKENDSLGERVPEADPRDALPPAPPLSAPSRPGVVTRDPLYPRPPPSFGGQPSPDGSGCPQTARRLPAGACRPGRRVDSRHATRRAAPA
jgi:hypothetical protein